MAVLLALLLGGCHLVPGLAVLVALVGGLACQPAPGGSILSDEALVLPPDPERCAAAPLDEPGKLGACDLGSGAFGRWLLDEGGLPSYDYRLDQINDPRATYGHSLDPGRTDHLHQIGNDRGFLDEEAPYYPVEAPAPGGRTVLDHLRNAAEHLITFVGRGENGLVRLWDGDWSDGIVWESPEKIDAGQTIERGESVPNTQMAVYVLPQLAALLEPRDAALARRLRDYAEELRAPLAAQFTGEWFRRAYLRDHHGAEVVIGQQGIDLEAQPWGLLAGDLLGEAQRAVLLDNVHERLSTPLGPALTPGGMVWPAIGQLMTWAYARHDRGRAWSALLAQSLARKAETYPDSWVGIWSGPDGLYSKSGKTWQSAATPMRDWPAMNNNVHAMFLLGLLRVAGVEPRGRALRVQPDAADPYTLDLPLLRLAVSDGALEGIYRAQNDGALELELAAPRGRRLLQATVDGMDLAVPDGAEAVSRPLTLRAGQPIPFTLRWE